MGNSSTADLPDIAVRNLVPIANVFHLRPPFSPDSGFTKTGHTEGPQSFDLPVGDPTQNRRDDNMMWKNEVESDESRVRFNPGSDPVHSLCQSVLFLHSPKGQSLPIATDPFESPCFLRLSLCQGEETLKMEWAVGPLETTDRVREFAAASFGKVAYTTDGVCFFTYLVSLDDNYSSSCF